VRPNHRGSFWNHPLAETAESEASVGRGLGRSGFAAITKTLINVLFRGRVYVWQKAHVPTRRKMKAQMTSGSGFWKRAGTFGPSRMVQLSLRKSPCVRANCVACAAGEGHRELRALRSSAVGNGIRSTCRKISSATCSLALENGRRLKDSISIAGERFAHALKNERRSRSDVNGGD